MADILPFKSPKTSDKFKGRTLCKNNHHKWEIVKNQQFDVKQGKLLSVYKCCRCGKIRNKLT